MEIIFKLVRISLLKTLLRPMNLLLVFLPVYTHDKIDCLTETNFWGIWVIFWIIIFLLQIQFIKRYITIGKIKLSLTLINIYVENKSINTFTPDQNLEILIEYNGYKGQIGKYNIWQLPILTREGIGRIEIIKDKKKYRYNFVSPRNNSLSLKMFAEYYQKNGNKVDIIFD